MPELNREQLHAVVYGRVQQVGFRDATRRRAADLGLMGWVCNRADSTVEVVAEGDRATLERFLTFLNLGPSAAQVVKVESEWLPATGNFADFAVR
ncbi:MAG: acylphosphatase [Chloroflexota bacterium]